MHINWPILVIVVLVILALLSFIIINNRRDRKKLEEQLNQDYSKPKKADTEEEDPEDFKQDEIRKGVTKQLSPPFFE